MVLLYCLVCASAYTLSSIEVKCVYMCIYVVIVDHSEPNPKSKLGVVYTHIIQLVSNRNGWTIHAGSAGFLPGLYAEVQLVSKVLDLRIQL